MEITGRKVPLFSGGEECISWTFVRVMKLYLCHISVIVCIIIVLIIVIGF